jgi:hypothetical protein
MFLNGCNEKKEQKHPPVPETVEETITLQNEMNHSASKEENQSIPKPSTIPVQRNNIYILSDQEHSHYNIQLEEDQLQIIDHSYPLILLNLFSTWSIPSQEQAYYLNQLQQRFKKDLLVIGILLHPDAQPDSLEKFMKENNATYFISNSSKNDHFAVQLLAPLHLPDMIPVPLTLVYHHGKLVKHYEGAVPIEMIEHDIKVLLEE